MDIKIKSTWARELITSISWSVTVWTTSFRFVNSPSGHWNSIRTTFSSIWYYLNKTNVSSRGIEITRPGKTSTQFRNATRGLVNADYITSADFFWKFYLLRHLMIVWRHNWKIDFWFCFTNYWVMIHNLWRIKKR